MDARLSAKEVKAIKRTEADLDKFVEARAEEAKNVRAEEAAWAASVRKYHRERNLAFTWEWHHFYKRLAHSHQKLADENEAKAASILNLLEEREGAM